MSPTSPSGSRASRRSTICAAPSIRTATNCSVTLTCTVDEIAAAADLVKGKLNGVPVAIVRGLGRRPAA